MKIICNGEESCCPALMRKSFVIAITSFLHSFGWCWTMPLRQSCGQRGKLQFRHNFFGLQSDVFIVIRRSSSCSNKMHVHTIAIQCLNSKLTPWTYGSNSSSKTEMLTYNYCYSRWDKRHLRIVRQAVIEGKRTPNDANKIKEGM